MSHIGSEARRLAATLLPVRRTDPMPSVQECIAIREKISQLEPADAFDEESIREAGETVAFIEDRIP